MKARWLVAVLLGLALLVGNVAPTLAGMEGGDPAGVGHGHI
jgi:hypothetical protein